MLAIPNRLPRGLALRTPQRPRIHLDDKSAYRKLAFSEPILGNAEEVLLGVYGNPVLARMLTLAPMKTGSAPQETVVQGAIKRARDKLGRCFPFSTPMSAATSRTSHASSAARSLSATS